MSNPLRPDPDPFAVTRTRVAADFAHDETVTGPSVPPPAAGWLPDVPGYTVLKELGRGGMGVVFEAVQTGLNRPVALKMVLNARLSTPERLVRFMIEAETLARLSHTNIVQIHEVGRFGSEGVPFLALEYVAGGTLADALQNHPLAPTEAAVLTERLARAVQHAHAHGVVHRDLKPGNVLLQPDHTPDSVSVTAGTGCRVFGRPVVPKVSDFGLAKSVSDPCGMTAQGTVVGTPSYMAPEQAAGRPDVSTAADVYSLGAVLYELLTGKPPYTGNTPVSVVRLVLEEAVVPPRQVLPGIPRDLEVICLKCLERDPDKRYPTADALADDLLRYRDGRPIRARPIGPAGRLYRWGRRNPTVAGLAAGVLLAVAVGAAGVVWQWRDAVVQWERAEQREQDAQRERERAEQAVAALAAARDQAEANFGLATDAVDRYLTGVSNDPRLTPAELAPLRKELIGTAREFYQKFVTDKATDPSGRAKLGAAYTQLATIAANADADPAGCADLAAKAVAVFDRLAAEFPDDPKHPLDRAFARQGLAHAHLMRNEPDQGFPLLDAVLAEYQRLAATSDAARDRLIRLAQYADTWNRQYERYPRAVEACRLRLAMLTEQAGWHPDRPRYAKELPDAAFRLGYALRRAGDSAADAALADAEARCQPAAGPGDADTQLRLADIAFNRGAAARDENRVTDGLAHFTTAIDRYTAFLGRWTNEDARQTLSEAEVMAADLRTRRGDHRVAHALIRRSVGRQWTSEWTVVLAVRTLEKAAEQARADGGLSPAARDDLAEVYLDTAGNLLSGLRGSVTDRADRVYLARTLATWPDPVYRNPPLAVSLARTANDPATLGIALYANGEFAAARTELDRAAAALDPTAKVYRAMAAAQAHDPAARKLYDAAVAAGPVPAGVKAEADRVFGLAPAADRPEYRAAVGLDKPGLDGWLKTAADAGFRPDRIHAHGTPGGPRFTAVAVRRPGSRTNTEVHFDTGVDGFQQQFGRKQDGGFWVISLCGYADAGQAKFVSVWANVSAGGGYCRHGIGLEAVRGEVAGHLKNGRRLLSLSEFPFDGRPAYTTVFGPDRGKDSKFQSGQPLSDYLPTAEGRRAGGWRPGPVAVRAADGEPIVTAVGVHDPGTEWAMRAGLTAAEVDAETTRRAADGFRPEQVVGYTVGADSRYLAVWVREPAAGPPRPPLPTRGQTVPALDGFDRAMRTFMADRDIPAGTLAVMKDGRLLLARGYGYADRERTRPVEPDTPFRLASLSKPLTAAAVRRLIAAGKLTEETKVAPLLGLADAKDPRWTEVTVGHLLAHRGGFDRAAAGDPMFRTPEVVAALKLTGPPTSADVVRYMAARPLQFDPDTKTAYSNFGYCVLGRVIETTAGRPYLEYLCEEVLAPIGVCRVKLGRTLPADRDPAEPFYSDPARGRDVIRGLALGPVPTPDGGFHLEAMDAHGGLTAPAPDLVRFLHHYTLDGRPAAKGSRGTFFGSLPGTFTLMTRRPDGVLMAALFNQRADDSGKEYGSILELLNAAADAVTSWPE